jgi:hypothetical protein
MLRHQVEHQAAEQAMRKRRSAAEPIAAVLVGGTVSHPPFIANAMSAAPGRRHEDTRTVIVAGAQPQ